MLVTIITAGLVVVLVSIFAWQVMAARQQQREAARIKTQVKIARDTVSVREALRAELGVIGLATAADLPASPQTMAQLRTLHARSSAALQMLETELNQNSAVPGGAG